jgi:general secretion pathway protein A
MKEIYQASGGIPRLINIICDAALVTGYVEECQQIDDKLVKGVIDELEIDAIRGYPEPAAQKPAAKTVTPSISSQDKKELPYGENELYARYQFQLEWEKRLSEKQKELNAKQEELYQKLDQLIHLERELIVREEMIKKREMELGISVNTEAVR